MSTIDMAAKANAADVLRTFKDVVATLCAALPSGVAAAERKTVQALLGPAESAIGMLVPAAPLPPAATAAVSPAARPQPSSPARAIADVLGMAQFDDFEDELLAVSTKADQGGRCAVAAILHTVGLVSDTAAQLPQADSAEVLRGRMLRVAEYVVRTYLPKYLVAQELDNYVENLAQIPELSHRDALPPAAQALRDLAEATRTSAFGEYFMYRKDCCHKAGWLFGWLSGTLRELDGYVPKPGLVMARLLWALRDKMELVDKEELERLLLEA